MREPESLIIIRSSMDLNSFELLDLRKPSYLIPKVMGNGTNGNGTIGETNLLDIRFQFIDVIAIAFLIAIFIIGVAGNGLVVYIFGIKTGRRMQRFEHFLLLLGVVDLISSFLIPTSFFYLTATGFQRWDFGKIGCKIIPSLLQISITVSQGVLILISYERYHTLTRPFNNRLSSFKIALWMVFVVALSIAFVWPYLTTLKVIGHAAYGMQTCVPDGFKKEILLASSLIQLKRDILALGIMLFLGHKINVSLTEQHESLTWKRKNLSSKGRRVLRFLIVVFATLTLPVDIFQCFVYTLQLAKVHLSPVHYQAILVTNTLLNLLQTSNSVVNVFIYSRVHDNFRLKIFKAKKKLKRQMSSFYKTETEHVPLSDLSDFQTRRLSSPRYSETPQLWNGLIVQESDILE